MNLSFVYLGESQYFTKLEKPDNQGNPGWDAFGGHMMLHDVTIFHQDINEQP